MDKAQLGVFSQAMAECTDIISLSKLKLSEVKSSSDVYENAKVFCKEYQSAKNSGSSMAASASYKFFSASYGQSAASAEDIASKHCETTNIGVAKADSYQNFVETIAPGAFDSYNRCLQLNQVGVHINVNKNSILPNYFTAQISITSNSAKPTETIAYAASPDVNCKWEHGGNSKQVTIGDRNRSEVLTCTREKSDVKSSVDIYVTTRPNSLLSFSWTDFKNELPVDTLKQLNETITDSVTELKNALNELNETRNSFRDSVVPFVNNDCPNGWYAYKPAYGRFIRGIDRIGGVDVTTNRPLEDIQLDAFQIHNHKFNETVSKGHGPGGQHPHGYMNGQYGVGVDTTSSIVVFPEYGQPRGSTETRPVNVALLYCRRK